MANTEIYLVRHGLPEYKHDAQGRKLTYGPEVGLSEQGKTHVHALAKKLPSLDVIYTSPFIRAKETAAILASDLKVERIIDYPALSDFYSRNSLGMLLDDALAGKIPAHPDDETLERAYARVLQGFGEILEKEKGLKVGVVSHGHPIRFVAWRYVEGKLELSEPMDKLVTYNYPLQAEALVLVWNESSELVENYFIFRDDNSNHDSGKW